MPFERWNGTADGRAGWEKWSEFAAIPPTSSVGFDALPAGNWKAYQTVAGTVALHHENLRRPNVQDAQWVEDGRGDRDVERRYRP